MKTEVSPSLLIKVIGALLALLISLATAFLNTRFNSVEARLEAMKEDQVEDHERRLRVLESNQNLLVHSANLEARRERGE